MRKRKPYKTVSLFSGAMGLDIGFEQTQRYETLAAVEVDPVYCATIRRNRDAGRTARQDLMVIQRDIRKVCPRELLEQLGLKKGELDVLIGGPPCQTFSTSGRRQTTGDYRGTLLWDFLRFVEAIQPKFFVMENVRGLVSAATRHRKIRDRPENGGPPLSPTEMPGSVLRQFAEDLSRIANCSYRLDAFEVNAVNYGAPQLRERLICIGNRLGHIAEFPAPTNTAQPAENDGEMQPFRTLGDVIEDVFETEPAILDFSPRKKHYLSMVPPGGNWRLLPIEIQRESMGRAWYAKGGRSGWWRRLSFDLPCPTIVTMPNHASTSLCHPVELRALSAHECALIQEFSADWEFAGSVQEKYAQIGNAVPIRLAKVAAEVLCQYLDIASPRSTGISLDHDNDVICTPNFRLVYLKSHVRTRKWYQKGRSYVWQDGKGNKRARYKPAITERRERAI